eukprot:9214958-Pyramimonas_sp.AAC.1
MQSMGTPRKLNITFGGPGNWLDEGEMDLMLYKKRTIFHIMDRCIRLAAGQEITDRERDAILDAYHYCWIADHGPFK